jgi:hypothetical protein
MVLVVPTVLFEPTAGIPPVTVDGDWTGAAVPAVAPAGVAVCVPDEIPDVPDPAVGVVPIVPAPVVAGVPGVAVPPVCAIAHVAARSNPNVNPKILCIVSPSLPRVLVFAYIRGAMGIRKCGMAKPLCFREFHTHSV